MNHQEKVSQRKFERETEARRLCSLLSVDQVATVATFFRSVTGSPHSSRNRHYIQAGRAAFIAICFGDNHLPKEISKFLASQRNK